MRLVRFYDSTYQYLQLREQIHAAALEVLDSQNYILGPHGEQLEIEFAGALGLPFAVGVSSGTGALHLALLACGVQPGDEVITTPFTFAATVAAILYCGARPVLADIDPQTLNIDPAAVAAKITSRTRAILPVHLYGLPAEMTPILELARQHHLFVIEDAAQAHGATYHTHHVGSLGEIGCFSFYPSKNLGACGDAGILVTQNPELASRVRLLRNWGQTEKYHHACLGFNYRLDELQAAILRVKLKKLPEWNLSRRKIALIYEQSITTPHIVKPSWPPGLDSAWHLYTIRTARRDELRDYLQARGISTAIHYPRPLHLQPAYSHLGYHVGDLPNAELAARQVLSLPLYPGMPEDDALYVVETIHSFFR